MRCLFLLLTVILSADALATPAGRRKGPPRTHLLNQLAGDWHSTSLSGDAIGLAVTDVVITFKPDKTFTATANLNIGGPNHYRGAFEAKLNTLILKTEAHGVFRCSVDFHQSDAFILKPKSKSITAHFARGQAPASSGGWF